MNDFNSYTWRQSCIEKFNGKEISPVFNLQFNVSYAARSLKIEPLSNFKAVIFGIPRSGNTWLQTMLSIILGVPIIDPWSDENKCGIGMCHRPLAEEVFLRKDFVHGICLLRDIRDIASSYFTFVQSDDWRSKNPWFTTFGMDSFFYEYFFPRMDAFYDIKNYWDKYTAFNLPIIKYENLVINPYLEIKNTLEQMGFMASEELIFEAVESTSFEKLKREGVQGYEFVSPTHFGRGISGSYREILPIKIINEIELRYGDVLRKWGYKI